MDRGLQQDQKSPEPSKKTAVDVAASTPAMQALIEAASEAQTTENYSLLIPRARSNQASRPHMLPSVATNLDSASSLTTTTLGANKSSKSPTTSVQESLKRRRERDSLAHLDPNEHARVSDPIVRPAKKNKNDGKSVTKSSADDSDSDHVSAHPSQSNGKNQPIGFSDSILSRLFEPDRKQKPKLWEFIRLVAPGPANQPPPGQYKWRSKDAIAAYCLKCKLSFTYTPGTSKTVSRHLIAHHGLNGPKIDATKKVEDATQLTNTKETSQQLGGNDINDILQSAKDRAIIDAIQRSDLPLPGHKRYRTGSDLLAYRNKCMEKIRSDEDQDEDSDDISFKGHIANQKAEIAKALFRWWVGSYFARDVFSGTQRSLFVNFCKTLKKSFEMPDITVMNSMAMSSYDRLQSEIKIHGSKLFPKDSSTNNKSNEFISVSVRQIKVVTLEKSQKEEAHGPKELNSLRTFYPVRVSFCTPMFRMKSYVIAVIPEEKDQGQNNSEGQILSSYSRAVDLALAKHGIPRENISRVVIRGSSEEIEKGMPAATNSDASFCILDRLDAIFAKVIRSRTLLPEHIQKLLRQQQSKASTLFCTIRAHKTLVACLPQSDEAEAGADKTVQDHTIIHILDTITPLRDAIQTLSEDLYPTVGLAVPVLRRVNELLHQRLLDQNPNIGQAEKQAHENLKPFLISVHEDFKKIFEPFLKTNPDLMWTLPLDPRLIAMPALSEAEQTKAVSMLVAEVEKIAEVVDRKAQNSSKDKTIPTAKRNKNKYSSSYTMGGIFWGDMSDHTGNNGIDTNQVSSIVKDAKQYAKKNVESYFNAVHSQRQIKDPLLWWKNNQDQFPEIAILARKWLSSSAVYGRKNTRQNESTGIVSISSYDTEKLCRMMFLHDNNDIL